MTDQEMADTSISKYLYRVYEAQDTTDYFSYDAAKCLFEHQDLSWAHDFAYKKWLKDKTRAFTVIQPYDGSCRGGYGFPVEDEE
jgi:hypothetical protein